MAALVGTILSILIFRAAGIAGLSFLAAFFIIGSLVTSWKLEVKQKDGLAETGKGKRNAGQVLANAGMAGMISVLVWCAPELRHLVPVLIASCFSSATADTVSSELGNVCGKRFYEILNFKKGSRGANGVVSVEGTMAGLLGSFFIGGIYVIFYREGFSFFVIVIAGMVGNLADSVLGATLERNKMIGNNLVNFLNTFVAAITAWCLMQ